MPKRKYKRKERFETEEVQGPGSWVELLTPTFEDLESVINNGAQDNTKNQMEVSKALLQRLLVAWNWVGDDDMPLDQPNDNPAIIQTLPIQETMYLMNLVKISEADTKKKSPGK